MKIFNKKNKDKEKKKSDILNSVPLAFQNKDKSKKKEILETNEIEKIDNLHQEKLQRSSTVKSENNEKEVKELKRIKEEKAQKIEKKRGVGRKKPIINFKKSTVSILINRLDIPNFKDYLDKAGIDNEFSNIAKTIRNFALFLNFLLSFYFGYKLFLIKPGAIKSLFIMLIIIGVGFVVFIMIGWLLFYVFVDLKAKKLKTYQTHTESATKGIEIKKTRSERKRTFNTLIEKAGINFSLEKISLFLFRFAVLINLGINAYLFYNFSDVKPGIIFTILSSLILWTLGFTLLLLLMWVLFFVYIDIKIYQRKKEIEDVFPDFLQLTAANISSGMTIDRALWFAVRPRFGVLAKEIEDVAKSTLVGENLKDALLRFVNKYDSLILQRSINLLLEGLEAGGNIAPLLNKISVNIQETKIIKKEMAANVTTYVIFISFASIIAAPFLFALATELIVIMQKILGGISVDGGGSLSNMFTIDASGIDLGEFKIFVYMSMFVTSTFSAIIVSIIRKGNIKDGIQYIPIYIAISYILYFISFGLLKTALGGMF